MPCPNLDNLSAYQSGLLSARRQAHIRQHLAECVHCRAELHALINTTQLLAGLPSPPLPDNLWQGVAARLRPVPRFARVWKTAAGLAMAAALAFGIFNTRHPEPPPATGALAAYAADHALLATQDPLADRAGIGVMLATQGSRP